MQRLLLIALTALLVGLPISASQAVEDGLQGPAKALAGLAHHDGSPSLSSLDADTDEIGSVSLVTLGALPPARLSVSPGGSALACRQVTLPPVRAPPHCL
ncbi:MAG: hypothetical protein LPK20_07065 [Halomonas sp.]|uniref:hypothetical protein n=1 Tax=Halomonas sp. MCCC 1A11057 TaxID=2733482 RepID=UPI001F1999CC|nr:hypothetical protein [Halomonas sp. MCCC 1A11057]MCE8031512.1 hypothetical protein [Halomonas sp. MCCC 1A11057]MDX5433313.1 hypothetical protein [Halomonas sp.]